MLANGDKCPKQFQEETIASHHVAWKYSVKHWKIMENPSK
jgi:hypothetical protein